MPAHEADVLAGKPREHRYSVILSSRNEGESLYRTIEDLFLHAPEERVEVIIVDDASADGSTEFLEDARYAERGVQLLRNGTRKGLIWSRARAAGVARGRYLVFLDAHCALSPGWLGGLEAELRRIRDRGIAVPLIYGLRSETWTVDLESAPGAACTIVNPFLDFFWTEPLELDGHRSSCMIGGGAWMCSRKWYRHIGGLDRGMVSWGGENIDVSLRTWLAGGWCVVAGDVRIGHLFRRTPPDPIDRVEVAYNKIRAAHNAFSEETFHQIMLRLRYLDGFREALKRLYEDRERLGRTKQYIESIRKRSDRWIIENFRLPLLEPPFFYRPPRRGCEGVYRRHRPLVSVVVPACDAGEHLEALLFSILDTTSYGNYEVVIVSSGGMSGASERLEEYRDHPRLRFLHSAAPLAGGMADNLWAFTSEAEYCAFLSEDAVILDEHWLEKFLVLFERRERLFLACPRVRQVGDGGQPDGSREDSFDASWHWEAPHFSRARMGEPLAEVPYQALSCPGALLFARRRPFVELGGFDQTVRKGDRPVMDLAIRGWLCGYEVFCHPAIVLGRRSAVRREERPGDNPELLEWREYVQFLPAAKCFTDLERQRQCRKRSRRAEPLLLRNGTILKERRREFLSRARFDDDWLFYKFRIEAPYDGRAVGADRDGAPRRLSG